MMENKNGYQPSEEKPKADIIVEKDDDAEGITIKISGKKEALMMLDNIDIYFK